MANTSWSTSDKTASVALSGSNLTATITGSNQGVRAVDQQITGKFYFELTATTWANSGAWGIATLIANLTTIATGGPGAAAIVFGGQIVVNAVVSGYTLGTRASGNIIGFAVDLDNRLLWCRVAPSGNWNGIAAANPATTSFGVDISALGGGGLAVYPMLSSITSTQVVTANFGDTAFSGTVPSGFTSGFTAGTSPATNVVASQIAAEHWLTTTAPAQVTQVAIEQWAVPNVPLQVTQIAVEEWARADPPAQVTQIAVEEWASVEATYAVPVTPAFMLAGSRAGIGSAVLVQDNADRTVMLAGVGALSQTAQTVTTPSAGDAVRAIIMA